MGRVNFEKIIMGGIGKIIVVVMLVLGVLAAWKYIFAPTVSINANSALLDVTAKDWVEGKSDAPVTMVEYTDFQCPACGVYYPIVKQLLEEPESKFKLVVRYYPLVQIHQNALVAARAAEAAGRQGKFWEMHDLLFSNQKEWSEAADPNKSIFPAYAGRIGIDVEQFRKDVADPSIDDKINQDRESGNTLKLQGTPTFFLNGEQMKNPTSIDDFRTLIEAAALKAPVKTGGSQPQ